MGTYLGQLSLEDDNDIENAVYESIKSGAINVIDTAINYRGYEVREKYRSSIVTSQ